MAQHNVKEILAADGSPVYAEVANRDALGRKIDTTYATTDYVTTGYLPLSGGNLTSNLTVSGTVSSNEFIVNSDRAATTEYSANTITYNPDRVAEGADSPLILTFPSNSGTIATREWTQQQGYAVGNLANYLPLSGGTLTGNLNIQSGLNVTNDINANTFIGDKVLVNHFASTSSDYIEFQTNEATFGVKGATGHIYNFEDYLPLSGGTLTGNLNIQSGLTVRDSITAYTYGFGENMPYIMNTSPDDRHLWMASKDFVYAMRNIDGGATRGVDFSDFPIWGNTAKVASEEWVNTYAISAKPRNTGVSNDVSDITKLPDTSNTVANIQDASGLGGLYKFGTMLDFACPNGINGAGRTQIYIPDISNPSVPTNFIGIREQYGGFPTSAQMSNVAWKYIPTMSTTDAIATQNWVNSTFLPLAGGTITGNLTVNSQLRSSNGFYGASDIGNNEDALIRSSTQSYLEASNDPIVDIALNKKGQVGFELSGTKTARLNFGTSAGDTVFTFPSTSGTMASESWTTSNFYKNDDTWGWYDVTVTVYDGSILTGTLIGKMTMCVYHPITSSSISINSLPDGVYRVRGVNGSRTVGSSGVTRDTRRYFKTITFSGGNATSIQCWDGSTISPSKGIIKSFTFAPVKTLKVTGPNRPEAFILEKSTWSGNTSVDLKPSDPIFEGRLGHIFRLFTTGGNSVYLKNGSKIASFPGTSTNFSIDNDTGGMIEFQYVQIYSSYSFAILNPRYMTNSAPTIRGDGLQINFYSTDTRMMIVDMGPAYTDGSNDDELSQYYGLTTFDN